MWRKAPYTLVKSSGSLLTSYRTRANYYKNQDSWLGRKLRRFVLQYPKSPFIAIFVFCIAGMFAPHIKATYKALTMSKEEYVVYRDHYNGVIRQRQKFGTDLYIPFFTKNKADHPEETNSGNE